ncbi:MAG: hypothetical protein ABR615_03295 [Pseudonocardiaceae bacterium]
MSDYELVNELSESTTVGSTPRTSSSSPPGTATRALTGARADRFDEGVAGYREQLLAAAAGTK